MAVTSRMQTVKRRQRLLEILSDGKFHSGEVLASKLKVSRSAVWKLVRSLRAIEIEIQAVQRQGYRLPRAVQLYDHKEILGHVSPALSSRLQQLDVLLEVNSTNRYLSEQSGPEIAHASVCIAELQSAGRGRRGRTWIAPFGSGICLSLAWRFADAPPTLSALGLAVGVAVMRTLQQFGATDIGLKWPNDVLWRGRKLAGILIEMAGESDGPTRVVIGVGLNVRMPPQVRLTLAEQQSALIADLTEILRDHLPDRNLLAATVIAHLVAVLEVFATEGFAAFAEEWRRYDAMAQAAVRVVAGTESVSGIAEGVAEDGALLVNVQGETRRFVSADVSLRAAKGT